MKLRGPNSAAAGCAAGPDAPLTHHLALGTAARYATAPIVTMGKPTLRMASSLPYVGRLKACRSCAPTRAGTCAPTATPAGPLRPHLQHAVLHDFNGTWACRLLRHSCCCGMGRAGCRLREARCKRGPGCKGCPTDGSCARQPGSLCSNGPCCTAALPPWGGRPGPLHVVGARVLLARRRPLLLAAPSVHLAVCWALCRGPGHADAQCRESL